MRRHAAIWALALCLVGCGGHHEATPTSSNTALWTATAATPSTKALHRKQLERALLPVTALPPGFAKDAAPTMPLDCDDPDAGKRPDPSISVHRAYSHTFSDGPVLIGVSIFQFASAHDADRAFADTAKASCPPQQVEGETVTPLRVPAPHLGQASTGLRIMESSQGSVVYDVLDGRSIIAAQIVTPDEPDLKLLRKVIRQQVRSYETAAT